jgi:hypothetical protein
VDGKIVAAGTDVVTAQGQLQTAKDNVIEAKLGREEASARFDKAQQNLGGLVKQIQEGQAQVARRESAAKDADSKHQPVETVVFLDDLSEAINELQGTLSPEYETRLWAEFYAALRNLIKKTDEYRLVLPTVAVEEQKVKSAEDALAEKQKTRLDTIKKLLTDEQGSASQQSA